MWKIQYEHATVPVRPVGTSDSNRPETLMHQIQRDPEPESGAPDALGGKKRLKDSLQRLLIHARPCIGNGDANSFAAILSSPIKVDGKTVVPKGAHVAGRVVTAKKAGPAELTVALTAVEVNGKSYKLATEPINRTGKTPAKDAGDADSAKPQKDITVAAQSHLKFKLAKPAKIPVKS